MRGRLPPTPLSSTFHPHRRRAVESASRPLRIPRTLGLLISPSLCCFPRAHATPAFLPFSALTPLPPQASFLSPPPGGPLNFPEFSSPTSSAIVLPRTRAVVAAPPCPDPPCRIFCSQVARRVPSLFYTRTRFPAEMRATASAYIPLSVASPPPPEPPPALAACVGPFWVGRAPPGEHQGILLSTPRSGAQRRGAGDSDLLAPLDWALRWPVGVWEERGEVDCTRGGSALQPSASGGWRAERLHRETAVRNCRSFSCFPTASKMGVALPKTLDFFFFFNFCSVVLISAIQQGEPGMIMHVSAPFQASLPSPHPIPPGHHRARDWAPSATHNFLPVLHLIPDTVCMLMLFSAFLPLSPPSLCQ